MSMMGDIREHVRDWYDRDEVAAYIQKIVNKEAFDRTGLALPVTVCSQVVPVLPFTWRSCISGE